MPESFFNKVAGLRQVAQVFSCEFCEICKNTFFHRTPQVAASDNRYFTKQDLHLENE